LIGVYESENFGEILLELIENMNKYFKDNLIEVLNIIKTNDVKTVLNILDDKSNELKSNVNY